jgi:hypothetical protein
LCIFTSERSTSATSCFKLQSQAGLLRTTPLPNLQIASLPHNPNYGTRATISSSTDTGIKFTPPSNMENGFSCDLAQGSPSPHTPHPHNPNTRGRSCQDPTPSLPRFSAKPSHWRVLALEFSLMIWGPFTLVGSNRSRKLQITLLECSQTPHHNNAQKVLYAAQLAFLSHFHTSQGSVCVYGVCAPPFFQLLLIGFFHSRLLGIWCCVASSTATSYHHQTHHNRVVCVFTAFGNFVPVSGAPIQSRGGGFVGPFTHNPPSRGPCFTFSCIYVQQR